MVANIFRHLRCLNHTPRGIILWRICRATPLEYATSSFATATTSDPNVSEETLDVDVRFQEYNRGNSKRFVDKARIRTFGGRGGNGCISFDIFSPSWRRPSGGHGGAGGDVIIEADASVGSLDLGRHHFRAKNGANGGPKNAKGRRGDDLVVRVPPGTVVRRVVRRGSECDGSVEYSRQGRVANDEDEEEEEEEDSDDHDDDVVQTTRSAKEANKKKRKPWLEGAPSSMLARRNNRGNNLEESNESDWIEEDPYEEASEMDPFEEEEEDVEEDEEMRIDPSDGQAYTRSNFVDFYGRTREWNNALPVKLMHAGESGSGSGSSSSFSSSSSSFSSSTHSAERGPEALSPFTAVEVADLAAPGERYLAAGGGRPGLGNAMLARARHRVSRSSKQHHRTLGDEGTEIFLELELKTIAQVGLVGFPNAGKSSFLAATSNAKPHVAPYPFTTLKPGVGVLEYSDFARITVADIPGLVEGAARENRGLGHAFLRHIERVQGLVFVVDVSGGSVEGSGDDMDSAEEEGEEAQATAGRTRRNMGLLGGNRNLSGDPCKHLLGLFAELEAYAPGLARRPSLVLANKIDLPEAQRHLPRLRALAKDLKDSGVARKSPAEKFPPPTSRHGNTDEDSTSEVKVNVRAYVETSMATGVGLADAAVAIRAHLFQAPDTAS